MKELLEDYKRRLENVREEQKHVDYYELEKHIILETKASCYRTFIAELEKIINQTN